MWEFFYVFLFFFCFCVQRGGFLEDVRGGFSFASAYSGDVFPKTFEGDFLLLLLTAGLFTRRPSRGIFFCFCLQRFSWYDDHRGGNGFRTGVQRWGFLEDLRGGVLPDGTQRIGEGGNRCSNAAPSSLPYPPRPPTPPSLSRLCDCLGATPGVTWLKALG